MNFSLGIALQKPYKKNLCIAFFLIKRWVAFLSNILVVVEYYYYYIKT